MRLKCVVRFYFCKKYINKVSAGGIGSMCTFSYTHVLDSNILPGIQFITQFKKHLCHHLRIQFSSWTNADLPHGSQETLQ